MNKCKVCNTKTDSIINFGRMPISNAFLKKTTDPEYFYNLELVYCPQCHMVQIGEVPKPEQMFGEEYAFFSMTSKVQAEHFREQADQIIRFASRRKDPFVVELGSNDGIMLKHVAKAGIKNLGIEPATNVAEASRQEGVNALEKFFDENLAQEIIEEYGNADVISAANTLLSVENINSAFEGFRNLLKDDGVLFFEDPYIYDIVTLASFDQIYDEHIFFFSGLSVQELGKRHNLTLVDMEHQDVHGGSMRYYLKKGRNYRMTKRAEAFLEKEKELGLDSIQGYASFRDRVNKVCHDLKEKLDQLKREGHQIVGYGATSKSTTLFNYANIGPDTIDYICDTTPTKINHFTPGKHIPVVSHDIFIKDNPPFTLLLAWNHKREIFAKEEEYRKKGGTFITYFPEVTMDGPEEKNEKKPSITPIKEENQIEGVIIKELKVFADERGTFAEIFRQSDEIFQDNFGQLSFSTSFQNVAKAWHLHHKQTDWMCTVVGDMKLALYDTRENSPTHGQLMEILMGESCGFKVVKIPAGVAHGYKIINGPMYVIYVFKHEYDPEDEHRLPHNDPKIGYDWVTGPTIK